MAKTNGLSRYPAGGEIDEHLQRPVAAIDEQVERLLYLRQRVAVGDDRRSVDPPFGNPPHRQGEIDGEVRGDAGVDGYALEKQLLPADRVKPRFGHAEEEDCAVLAAQIDAQVERLLAMSDRLDDQVGHFAAGDFVYRSDRVFPSRY